jgi:MoxR-like ATPase
MSSDDGTDLRIFRGGDADPKRIDSLLPPPPPWRRFGGEAKRERGQTYQASEHEIELVNAALFLRRPLLVTGKPGTGKSSLAYAVAEELGLGAVLHWPITTRSTLAEGLYQYDAIARLQDAALAQSRRGEENPEAQAAEPRASGPDIGRYIRLGPLGTALLPQAPPRSRVLLIDEIDKSDIDLPHDLLHVFEEGEFEIPELSRLPDEPTFRQVQVFPYDGEQRVPIERGRDVPPPFLRRCLRLELIPPSPEKLTRIVEERLGLDDKALDSVRDLVSAFVDLRDLEGRELATDQLLNAVYMRLHGLDPSLRDELRQALLRSLSEAR